MTSRLPDHENKRQQSVNNCWSCMMGNQGIAPILQLITEPLTPLLGNNTKWNRKNIDFKIINIENCKTCKKRWLDVESAILIRYYYQTAKRRALYESTNRPAGWPTDNQPNSVGLAEFHWNASELTVPVCWQPGLSIWIQFSFDPDPYPNWWSRTIADTGFNIYQYLWHIDFISLIWIRFSPKISTMYLF